MDYLSAAILKLKPNSEFVYFGEDYSSIQWIVLEGEAPTQEEINAAIEQVKADEIAKTNEIAAAKAALLERLGITEDEAKLLLA